MNGCERHLDKLLAFLIFLIVIGVFCAKGESEFTQGLVTGSMLTISTLLGTRGVTRIVNGNGNGNGDKGGNGNGAAKS